MLSNVCCTEQPPFDSVPPGYTDKIFVLKFNSQEVHAIAHVFPEHPFIHIETENEFPGIIFIHDLLSIRIPAELVHL